MGSVTRQKICQPDAPSTTAASSSSRPWACITGMSSRATKGKVTKTVARTIPGTAKTTFRSWAASHGPSQPCRPKSRMKTTPEITGEMAKGRSIRVSRRLRPGKSNRAIAQEAARPKRRLAGTAIAAVRRVSRSAESASGSRMAAR